MSNDQPSHAPHATGPNAGAPGKAPAPLHRAPGGAHADPVVPPWVRVLWRGLLFIEFAAFFTAAAMVLRALIGGFGTEPLPLVAAAAATLVAGVLVLPLAVAVDLPDAIFCHWLPARRAARGRCPACGFSATRAPPAHAPAAHASPAAPAAHTPEARCTECQSPLAPPPRYTVSVHTLRSALLIAAPAWLAGCAIGLVVVMRDEYSFTVETQRQLARDARTPVVTRPRAGIASFVHLRWTPAEGFTAGP